MTSVPLVVNKLRIQRGQKMRHFSTSVSSMEELGSNLGPETSYLDCKFSEFSAGKCKAML